MVKIFLAGSEKSDFIIEFINNLGECSYISKYDVKILENAEIFVINNLPTKEKFDFIVFKDGIFDNLFIKDILTENTFVFLESTNKKAIKLLKGLKNPCICCGHSEKDTISISSVSEDSITFCIQRSIEYKNKILDEQECPVKIEKHSKSGEFGAICGGVLSHIC